MAINSIWLKGLDKEDRELFTKKLQGSLTVLERLEEILKERLGEKETKQLSVGLFEEPAYPYHQADINGAKRELRFLLDLLSSVTTGPQ